MWCPECNISGGCYCHEPPKVKRIPRDHEKEQKKYEDDLYWEIQGLIEEEKRIKQMIKEGTLKYL